ncbi:MAG TPA: THUMP domain-containing protein [Nitrososphaera sp.]|nr:THUMP domain-containing protein [Nitrososphaera sp.]
MGGFNLVFSTSRFREEEAQDEILDLLDMFGDQEAEAEITEVKGLLLAQTALDPFAVVDKLKELVASEPWQVRYILRVLPIEVVVPTELDAIMQAAKELAAKIGKDSFRITVEKRHSPLESIEVIKAIAGEIESKVDLENPGWIVLVEVVGNQTGVSVIRPDQVFSSVVEKRG